MNRNPYFDVVKALAMLVVVIGHTRWAYGCHVGNPAIDNFIVGMNMPIFFMISGYFSAKTVFEGNWAKLGQHLIGYFWPLAFFSCIFALGAVGFGLEGSDKGVIGYAGRNFLFSPWFLWCLAICFGISFLSARILKVSPLFALLAVYLLLPFLTGVWYVENVREMLPHFVFGMFVLRMWPIWKMRYLGMTCFVVYMLVILSSNSFRVNGLSFYNGETDYVHLFSSPFNVVMLMARILLGFVGSVGILWLTHELVSKFNTWGDRIAPFGRTTLGVYILHQWILARCEESIPLKPTIFMTLLFALLLFISCHYLTVLLKCSKWLRKLIWGLWWRR